MPHVQFVPIDKEQPELTVNRWAMEVIPFPGEEVEMKDMTVRVIKRVFHVGDAAQDRVSLYVRVLPPEGVL